VMASCKDCVHADMCRFYTKELAKAKGITLGKDIFEYFSSGDVCEDFKDRSRFVELPCKVGDSVYLDNLHIKYADVIGIYIDAFGGVFDLRIYTNIQLANGFGYEYFISKDYTFEDIGKRIFLTKEEAEQALKERENDGK
jgi:hypothetical protein